MADEGFSSDLRSSQGCSALNRYYTNTVHTVSCGYRRLPSSSHGDIEASAGDGVDSHPLLVRVRGLLSYVILLQSQAIFLLTPTPLLCKAARWLETYKIYENKSADSIQEKVEDDYRSKAVDALTTVRSVNSSDAATLVSTFKTIKNIGIHDVDVIRSKSIVNALLSSSSASASMDELTLCPGLGEKKGIT